MSQRSLKALLVEDDENKRDQIASFVQSQYPNLELQIASSLIGGLRAAKAAKPELILLDMTLPNFDAEVGDTGTGMHAFGGEEFLRQIERFQLKSKVILITQFETFGEHPHMKGLAEVDNDLKARFPDMYLGAIYYHATINEWMKQLGVVVDKILEEQ